MSKIIIKINNELSELDNVFTRLHTFALSENLDKKIVFNMHLALDEILNNTISYGYIDNDIHIIYVTIEKTNTLLNIEIRDDSKEYDITQRSDPDVSKPLGEKNIGGLGIYLVKNLFDTISYKRKNGLNILSMEVSTNKGKNNKGIET